MDYNVFTNQDTGRQAEAYADLAGTMGGRVPLYTVPPGSPMPGKMPGSLRIPPSIAAAQAAAAQRRSSSALPSWLLPAAGVGLVLYLVTR